MPNLRRFFFTDGNSSPRTDLGENGVVSLESGEDDIPLGIKAGMTKSDFIFPFSKSESSNSTTSNFASIWSDSTSFFTSPVFANPHVSPTTTDEDDHMLGIPSFMFDSHPPSGVDALNVRYTEDEEVVQPPPGFAPAYVNNTLFGGKGGKATESTFGIWGYSSVPHHGSALPPTPFPFPGLATDQFEQQIPTQNPYISDG